MMALTELRERLNNLEPGTEVPEVGVLSVTRFWGDSRTRVKTAKLHCLVCTHEFKRTIQAILSAVENQSVLCPNCRRIARWDREATEPPKEEGVQVRDTRPMRVTDAGLDDIAQLAHLRRWAL